MDKKTSENGSPRDVKYEVVFMSRKSDDSMGTY